MRRFLLLSLALLSLARPGFGRDITTLSGQRFRDVVVTGIDQAGVDIRFSGGTAYLNFADLPADEVAAFFQTGAEGAPPEATPPAPDAAAPEFDPNSEEAADSVAPSPDLQYVPEIDALDGSVYDDVVVTDIERTGLRFRHRNGTGFLDFSQLPDDLRRRYGYSDSGYARGKAWREHREQGRASTQRRSAGEMPARPAESQRPRASMPPAAAQPPPASSNPIFNTSPFPTREPITGGFQGGGLPQGSFSGRASSHMGGGGAHSSGGHR